MTSKSLFALLVVAPLALMVACKGEKRPDDLPELYPLSVKIIQDGQPLAEAEVALVPMQPAAGHYAAGGQTNEEGVAELYTYGFKGVPADSYRVTVNKTEYVNKPTTHEEFVEMEKQGLKTEAYALVDRQFADMSTTPLTTEVQASKSNPVLEFDVGAAIHEPIDLLQN